MDAARREALRILPELLEARLDEAYLVLVVVDGERRAVAEALRLAAKPPAARGVEGEDPDRPRRGAEHPLEALPHLPRRLVRERDREDLVRLDAASADQVGDAVGEDARLSGTRSGDDEERSLGGQDGLALGLVEVREVALGSRDGHAAMLPAARRSTFLVRRITCAVPSR